jgi:4-amino-4-deoxy-L-arabinose transferase-like glycosyltransferase
LAVVLLGFVALVTAPGVAGVALLRLRTRADGPSDPWASALGVFQVGVLALAIAALFLAEIARFSLGLVSVAMAGLAATLALLAWRTWRASPKPAPERRIILSRPSVHSLLLVALLLVCAIVYMRPAEYWLGGLDPGIYFITGGTIARTGALLIADPTVGEVPAGLRDLVFNQVKSGLPGNLFSGFYVRDSSGLAEPHGLHLFPALLAVLWGLGGGEAARYLSPLLGVVCVLAVAVLGARLFGRTAGLVGALLLATNASFIWFARYPDAEILALLLLVVGLVSLTQAEETGSGWHGTLAGVSLGAVALTKIELFAVPALICAYLAAFWIAGEWRRHHAALLLAYAIVLAYAGLHALLFATTYTLGVLTNVAPSLLRFVEMAATQTWPARAALGAIAGEAAPFALVAAGLAFILVTAARIWWRQSPALRPFALRWAPAARLVLAVAIVAGFAFGYFIRPDLSPASELPRLLTFGDLGGITSIATVGTPLMLLLTVAALVWLVVDDPRPVSRLIVGLLLAQAVVFSVGAFITPLYWWAARRYLPLWMPLAAIVSAFALVRITADRGRLRWLGAAALAGTIAAQGLVASAPFMSHVELEGSGSAVAALADALPRDAVVLIEWSEEGHSYGTP